MIHCLFAFLHSPSAKQSKMSMRQKPINTAEFLSSIDSGLEEFAKLLMDKGFSNIRTLPHLTATDIPEIPVGLRQLLIHEVSILRNVHTWQILQCCDIVRGVQTPQHNNDSPIVIPDSDSGNRHKTSVILRPKQLFPQTGRHGDLNLNSYEYQSPMEKHLSKILTETSEKELEIQKLKSDIDAMRPPEDNPSDNIAITCGHCHQGNHTKRRCLDPPCTTSISCGKIRFHESELKEFELKKAQLKKNLCVTSLL